MNSKKNKKEKLIELNVEAIGFEGIAIARKDGLVYFVKGAVPGDKVIARILRKRKNYSEAFATEILVPSPSRTDPQCMHFGTCGGCTWQNLNYKDQLHWKKQHLIDAFERIGGLKAATILDTIPSEAQFNYRNKMEFSFGASRWLTDNEINSDKEIENKDFALGLHIPGRFDKVLDVKECLIQPDIGNKILEAVRLAALNFAAPAYNQRTHTGFLRNLLIRTSHSSGEVMVVLITAEASDHPDYQMIDWFKEKFPQQFPEVSTIIWAINDKVTPVAIGEPNIIKGSGFITEEILGLKYRISPFSFFQTNSKQLNKFISLILDYAEINSNKIVWDLYCGTGSITLPAVRQAKQAFGMELAESSIKDAISNAELNHIKNVEFFPVDLHTKEVQILFEKLPKPDIMLIDPPRAGIHKNLIENILVTEPKRIVYVSCNPATQARDCAALSDKYKVECVQPVDMFPHTFHIESLALLVSTICHSH